MLVAALLALNFYLLDVRPFWFATLLVVANNAVLAAVWRPREGRPSVVSGLRSLSQFSAVAQPLGAAPGRTAGLKASATETPPVTPTQHRGEKGPSRTIRIVVAAAVIALLFVAAHAWLRQILIYPHDPQRADMLVVVQLGLRRLLQGRTPYTMYQIPWPVTLPYGPAMWAPMIVPFALHADVRFATLLGALFVPAVCAVCALDRARRGDTAGAMAPVIALAAIALSPDLRSFMSIGHTPAYWPLLPLFAWSLGRERWVAAAVTCGLLIIARTTMVALVPALLVAVWQRAHARAGVTTIALAAAIALPLLPFAVADPKSLQYAFYGSYQSVIKGFVWTSTEWAQKTIGLTGPLLTRGWRGAVEPVQALAMLATACMSWIRIRRGDDPVLWAALALLVFSMTTLWPVVYLYFDVFLLLVCAALVRARPADRAGLRAWWWRSLAAASGVLLATAVVTIPVHASIDAGTDAARPYLYAGFSGDERGADRTYAWINGTRAKILVPSLVRRDATLAIVCEPYLAAPGGRQQLTAVLNGVLLGAADVGDGWQTVTLSAPAQAWRIGENELELFLGFATSPRDAGDGSDSRRLSMAIDRLNVTSR